MARMRLDTGKARSCGLLMALNEAERVVTRFTSVTLAYEHLSIDHCEDVLAAIYYSGYIEPCLRTKKQRSDHGYINGNIPVTGAA